MDNLCEKLECRKGRDANTLDRNCGQEISTGAHKKNPKKNSLQKFRKTSLPKEVDTKAITLRANTIFALSQVMSSRRRLKSIMSNHRRTMKSKVPPPLCLTVTFYLRLHSSLSLLFNACLFLSIPLCIILSAQVLPAIAGEVAAYCHAYFIPSLRLGPLPPSKLLNHRSSRGICRNQSTLLNEVNQLTCRTTWTREASSVVRH